MSQKVFFVCTDNFFKVWGKKYDFKVQKIVLQGKVGEICPKKWGYDLFLNVKQIFFRLKCRIKAFNDRKKSLKVRLKDLNPKNKKV